MIIKMFCDVCGFVFFVETKVKIKHEMSPVTFVNGWCPKCEKIKKEEKIREVKNAYNSDL